MKTIELYNEDGDAVIYKLPSKKEVCPRCCGTGSHDPDAFSNGFTASEFNEVFEDEESRADYFRGVYDVTCEECNGNNVVDAPDEDQFSDADKAVHEKYLEQLDYDYHCEMEMAAERRMGA